MTRTQIVLWSTIALVALSVWFLAPTLKWYRMPASERQEYEKDKDPLITKS